MKKNIRFIIYLFGVAMLALVYYPLKGALSTGLFVTVVISYLLALRLLGEYIQKRVARKTEQISK